MRETILSIIRFALLAIGTGLAGLVLLTFLFWVRYIIGKLFDSLRWRRMEAQTEPIDFSEVDSLSVLPLFDWYATDRALISDAGFSLLVNAGEKTILFDLGDKRVGESKLPVLRNLEHLGYEPEKLVGQLSAIVVSHRHREHLGGRWAGMTGKPSLGKAFAKVPFFPSWKKADQPEKIAPGVLLSPRLASRTFFGGRIYERFLIVNVKGKGPVLIVGDAHPEPIPMILYAEHVCGQKPYAYIGGMRARLDVEVGLPWRWITAKRQPWIPVTPEEIGLLGVGMRDLGIEKLFVSAHDSDPVSLRILETVFESDLQVLQVGKKIEL